MEEINELKDTVISIRDTFSVLSASVELNMIFGIILFFICVLISAYGWELIYNNKGVLRSYPILRIISGISINIFAIFLWIVYFFYHLS